MMKHLTKHGKNLALVIDPPILEELGLDANTPVDVTTDGQTLVLTPIKDPQAATLFDAALDRANRKYPKALKKLAE